MVKIIDDTSKVRRLFDGMEDSLIQTCLQGMMDGKIYVTDTEAPRSAMAFVAEFAFLAGEPDRELAAFKPEGYVCMIPQDARWAELIEEFWPDADKVTRYAIKKHTKFDRAKLEAICAALPEDCELKRIDGEIFDMLVGDDLFRDTVSHFESKEQYLEIGRGIAVMKNGKPVSAASSYTVYREGIDIEIDTAEEERRKGFATIAGAALILSCLDDGLYPSWDAANTDSVRLAEKLGYEFSHEYTCYWLDALLDRVTKDPDKSRWESFRGRYESESGDKKVFEILIENGALYCRSGSCEDGPEALKLFPVGESTFGIMWADDEIVFSEGSMTVNGKNCIKL